MALKQLFQGCSVHEFITNHYFQIPYVCRGGSTHLFSMGAWEAIAAVVSQPEVQFLAARGSQAWGGSRPNSVSGVKAILDSGFTIGLRHIERCHQDFMILAEDFAHELGAQIDLHLNITRAGNPGFAWQYAAEEVFLFQLRGGSKWQIRNNTVNPRPIPVTLPRDLCYNREIMPTWKCRLRTGDWLYLPSGYWHTGNAIEESITLFVAASSPAAIDILDFLRGQLLSSPRWRRRLPCIGSACGRTFEETRGAYLSVLSELADDLPCELRQESFLKKYLDARGSVASLLEVDKNYKAVRPY